jgi:hypothetical protein
MGELELSAFAALKEVAVRVRALGDFPDEQVSVGLMAAAFSPKLPGPLADPSAEAGAMSGFAAAVIARSRRRGDQIPVAQLALAVPGTYLELCASGRGPALAVLAGRGAPGGLGCSPGLARCPVRPSRSALLAARLGGTAAGGG